MSASLLVDETREDPRRDTSSRLAANRLRVWLLTNAPSPYQSELFSAIADRDDMDLEVRFLQAGSPAGRSSANRYRSRVMTSIMPRGLPAELQMHPLAIWECAFGRHDCYVLSGLYTSITFLACALLLTIRGTPWVVWFERPRPDDRGRPHSALRRFVAGPFRQLRNLVRRTILGATHRLICIGTAAWEEYRAQGMPEDRMDVLPYCCDVQRFMQAPAGAVAEVTDRYRIEGHTVFLFSGQMIERKGIDTALQAFAKVAADQSQCSFLLLGDGPLKSNYESSVPHAARDRVHFLGHVPQQELPGYFAAADVFVFPSRHDGWGVVINEACAAGLPVITTRQTGAAHDLVEHGKNGFLFERDDVEGFAEAMHSLIDHPEQRAAYGRRSRELAELYSPERGAERFQQAIVSTCRG